MEDFRAGIKQAMARRGLNPYKVVRRCDPPMDLGYFTKMLEGDPESPGIVNIQKIAEAIGCETAEFFDDEKVHDCPKALGLDKVWPITKRELLVLEFHREIEGTGFEKPIRETLRAAVAGIKATREAG